MAAKKQLSFEQSMDRMEQIVKELERGECTLDEAMALFAEGSKLAGSCSDLLDKAEQKVTKLLSADGEEEVPFEEAGE